MIWNHLEEIQPHLKQNKMNQSSNLTFQIN